MKLPHVLLSLIMFYSTLCFAQIDGWRITADSIDNANYYGVTLSNGMLGIVSSPSALKSKQIILNGTYDQYGRGRVANIMPTFDFLNFDMEVDHLWLGKNEISHFTQTLDMKRATLETKFKHLDKIVVTTETMALRHLPHSAMVTLSIEAKKAVEITFYANMISPEIMGGVKNSFQMIDRPHALIPLITSMGASPTGKHTLAASSAIVFEESRESAPNVIYEAWDYNAHKMKFTKFLKPGDIYSFSVVGSSISTAHIDDPLNEAERLTIFAALEKASRLKVKHESEWDQLWKSDIMITGDFRMQQSMRLALYHLYSFVRAESAYSLSPMGLSGLGYNGHIFWDTEIWMFPVLVMLQPELAKSLLEYRYEHLKEARQNARMHGYKGAMFPWESDDNGNESTPVWALTGPFQHHITPDIAFAFWKYYQVTKDKEWLRARGYPVLHAVAEFLVSRVEKRDDGFHILNVVAADEFAENVDDNAYTQGVAKLALEYANAAALVLGLKQNPTWTEIAAKLVIPRFPSGVTREHANYNGETIKQCDVNLLAYPLGLIADKAQIRKDLEYYQPRLHPYGPAMSNSVLAILHAKLGDADKAYELLQKSMSRNMLPPFHVLAETWGGTNPYFITGGGGFLQTVLAGFGGLEITDSGIKARGGILPSHWKSLNISGVGVDKNTVTVTKQH